MFKLSKFICRGCVADKYGTLTHYFIDINCLAKIQAHFAPIYNRSLEYTLYDYRKLSRKNRIKKRIKKQFIVTTSRIKYIRLAEF